MTYNKRRVALSLNDSRIQQKVNEKAIDKTAEILRQK
jgi:hypothetical protein